MLNAIRKAAGLAVVLGVAALPAAGQPPADGPFRTVAPLALPLDKPGVWTLHFRYAPPRIITVDTGKGKKVVWYMFYQVYNTTDTPREFVPEFELVTRDLNTTHLDEPQPGIVEAVRKIEDPTGSLDLKTSNTISLGKVPVTARDSYPRYVSGVAVWTDVVEKAGATNRFSVYVGGLSNGVATVETPDGGKVVRKKVLRLDFTRPTDNFTDRIGDIRLDDNGGLGGERWEYRAIARRPATPAAKKDGGP